MQSRRTVVLFLVFAALAWAVLRANPQSGAASVQTSSGTPTGACQSAQADIDSATGNFWTCKAGVWTLASMPTGLPISCTTGSIGGSLLAIGASASGTASCVGATTAMICQAQASDGTNMAALGASPICTVTASGIATVNLVAIIALTPASKTYSVRVFP